MGGVGIFLDRDGTINEEVNFLSSEDQIRLILRSAEAIRDLNGLGLHVFVATNQSGIARGYLTEEKLSSIHHALRSLLSKEGAHLDGIYYCPHHPDEGNDPYRVNCECRKPDTGMLRKAAQEHKIDLTRSFVVGDRMIDVQTAMNAGAHSILVLTGYGREELELCRRHGTHPEHVANDLYEASQYIRQTVQRKQPSIC